MVRDNVYFSFTKKNEHSNLLTFSNVDDVNDDKVSVSSMQLYRY